MAANKANERAVSLTIAAPAAANGGIGPVTGDPLLLGVLACVAQNSYTPPTGKASGNIAADFEGAYFLEVTADSTLSPAAGKAINPGDPVYYKGGTLDGTTNVTYGGTLCADGSGVFFGNALDALGGGLTGTIRVRLQGKAA